MTMKRIAFTLGFAGLTCLLSGCANVKPWERGTLADYTMRGDRDPLAVWLSEHMWFSREAASGGRGVGRNNFV